jgi:ferredoxin
MRVIASTDKFIASGSCVLACPQVFGQRDEDGVVHILHEHPSLDLTILLVENEHHSASAFSCALNEASPNSTMTTCCRLVGFLMCSMIVRNAMGAANSSG